MKHYLQHIGSCIYLMAFTAFCAISLGCSSLRDIEFEPSTLPMFLPNSSGNILPALLDMQVPQCGLHPDFNPSVLHYTCATLSDEINITAAANPGDTLEGYLNGIAFALIPGVQSDPLQILNGDNTLTIAVSDGSQIAQYQIAVYKEHYESVLIFGTNGSGNGQFLYPRGVAVGPSGNVWVVDSNNHRVQKFLSDSTFAFAFGSNGSGGGDQMKNPYGIAISADGAIYITDTNNHRVKKFDQDGNLLAQWGSSGSGDGRFSFPIGIAVGSNGYVYVADTYNNRIQKFDANGNFIAKWGSPGGGDTQFNRPFGIAIDANDILYIADTYNNRIVVYDTNGNFVNTWGSYGTSNGQFKYPQGIAVSGEHVFVTEYNGYRVQLFSSVGSYITKWGSYGTGPNQFNKPFGIAVSSGGIVYVVEEQNHRVQAFDIL